MCNLNAAVEQSWTGSKALPRAKPEALLLLQMSSGSKTAAAAGGRKAPAGKTAKVLGGDEALTLRSKAAYNTAQHQDMRRPPPKRCDLLC